jgi:N-succinyldiaminopimelate aminotransferase
VQESGIYRKSAAIDDMRPSYNDRLFSCRCAFVNSDLKLLQPYPFEKLRQLFAGVAPAPTLSEIKLSIGEPQHETPPFIKKALADNLGGLANYPTTQGTDALRQTIAAWIARRYAVPAPDAPPR